MPSNSKIELTGGPELAAYLRQLPEKMMTRVLRRSLYAGVRKIQDQARQRVPILDIEQGGGPHYPGQLLENIKVSTARHGDEMRARCGITGDAFYGHFIEFGTVHAPAYPFMRPAADAAQGEAAQAVIDRATELCEKELGKAGS